MQPVIFFSPDSVVPARGPIARPRVANLLPSALLALILASALSRGEAATTPPASISRPNQPSLSGSGNSFTPSFSADGRFVLFVSQAKDLVTNGVPSPFLDLFMRDMTANQTVLLSVRTNGAGGGDGDSIFATVSTNSQWIAFESSAGNLTPNDTNGFSDVFVRDVVAGTTRLLSIKTNGVVSGSGHSQAPRISADGRRVVFESMAWNLATNDFNGSSNDVFVCDLPSGRIRFVSVNSSGTGSALGLSDSVSLSADGRYVAFRSTASNVVAGTSNRFGEIFVRDLENQTTIWASRDTGTRFTNGLAYACSHPAITADGRYVIYSVAEAFNSSSPRFLRRYDMVNGLTLAITNSFLFGDSPTVVSPKGRFVAYETKFPPGWTLADLDTGAFESLQAAGLAVANSPVFSADSTQVLFLGAASVNGPWSVYLRTLAGNAQELVSVATNGAAAGVGSVSLPAISADGRCIAFESLADNLVAGDLNQAADIFVRCLDTGETQLVSARSEISTPGTAARGAIPSPRAMSLAGRFVAFASLDNLLADGDDNPWQDVFVRDTLAGTNQLLRLPGPSPLGATRLAFSPVLSVDGRYAAWFEQAIGPTAGLAASTNILWLDRASGAGVMLGFAGAILGSPGPMMSQDGRWIAFHDRPELSAFTNVYVRDMLASTPTNVLVSVDRLNSGVGDHHSFEPAISPDNRWIAFLSRARNLLTNAPPSLPLATQVYARDLLTGSTRLISTDATRRNGLPGECSGPMFSGDSRQVFFFSRGTVNSSNILYRHDLTRPATNQNEIVCAGCSNPSASDDGRFVAYMLRNSASSSLDIYTRDLRDRLTTLVTTNVLGSFPMGGNRNSWSSLVSADVRYVVFASQAGNLVVNDTNNVTDIFVYDRAQRTTMAISASLLGGRTANGASSLPVLAPDGRTILFASFATDLAPGDSNNARDLYVLRLGGPDTDEDRLDDDWEVTYFNSLARDGTEDFDGDGWTDAREFQAGTDPTNSGSILRVLAVELVGGATRTIFWSSVPGRSYRVQVKFALSDPEWLYLPGRVTATGTTASLADFGSVPLGPPRFYRVEQEP